VFLTSITDTFYFFVQQRRYSPNRSHYTFQHETKPLFIVNQTGAFPIQYDPRILLLGKLNDYIFYNG
jgi:hypothetical protein